MFAARFLFEFSLKFFEKPCYFFCRCDITFIEEHKLENHGLFASQLPFLNNVSHVPNTPL